MRTASSNSIVLDKLYGCGCFLSKSNDVTHELKSCCSCLILSGILILDNLFKVSVSDLLVLITSSFSDLILSIFDSKEEVAHYPKENCGEND